MPEVAGLAKFSGRVDHGVKAVEFSMNFGEEVFDGVRFGDTEPRSANSWTKLPGGFENCFRGGGEPHLMAGRNQVTRNFETDATAAAGDKDAARFNGMRVRQARRS